MDHKNIDDILSRPVLSVGFAEVYAQELLELARLAHDGISLPDWRKRCEMLENTLRHARFELSEARTEIARLNSCETLSVARCVPALSEEDWAHVPGGREYGNGFRAGYELARSRSQSVPEEGGAS